jgi:type III secretion protein U
MAGSDTEEKNLPPSAKRLRDLKRKGNVPHSRDIPTIARLVAVVMYLIIGGKYIGEQIRDVMTLPQFHVRTDFQTELGYALKLAGIAAAQAVFPLLLFSAAAAVLAAFLDLKGIHISEKAGKFDFTKLNPVSGIKQIFTKRNLFDLLKAFALMILMAGSVWIIMRNYLNDLLWAPTCGMNCVVNAGGYVLLIIVCVGLALVILMALIDIPISRMLFTSENKMSVSERKREQKEEHGSPEVRKERRDRRNAMRETAGNVGIGKANLLLVGDGKAVGIRYIRGETPAPIVVAKGHDEALAEFRNTLYFNKGIVHDTPDDLVAALIKKGPLGEYIPKAYFDQIAGILIKTGIVS